MPHLLSEFHDSLVIAIEEFEEPFLRDFVIQSRFGELVPHRRCLFGTKFRYFAIERIPTICGPSGGIAACRDAACRIVEVAEIAATEGGQPQVLPVELGKVHKGTTDCLLQIKRPA